MKKLFLTLSVCASIFLTSCDDSAQPSYIEGKSNFISTNHTIEITYFKDKRTGLCYAERGQYYAYTMTCVPCDSVEKLIQK